MGHIENSYGFLMRNVLKAVNPIKKKIIKTECKVHKFITEEALEILRKDGKLAAHDFLKNYMHDINSGVVWADQDFKSSNHFYNPESERGLYGASNALKEITYYYTKSIKLYREGKVQASMFYFGCAAHILQDMTVPQHVNVKLLDSHRRYELWVIKTYLLHDIFKAREGGIYLDNIKSFIQSNADKAIETYMKFKNINNREDRYYKITSEILIQAQKSTAGFMLKYYNDIIKINEGKH
ncbi:Phospholipase C precursor [Caloramator mitchellensis]|uniref:Phospholipase C n=1 Tax=Caloramator mitchellensis TaxID=908809 RepID=A0A0R3JW80_CALMK|nr:zinc dependent phospholipase C family protein [Caloramator mitchellensis]KRQ87322.1 Phospholipase C precursor [Caloramator mitchellensis]